jgi:hypothetical protein
MMKGPSPRQRCVPGRPTREVETHRTWRRSSSAGAGLETWAEEMLLGTQPRIVDCCTPCAGRAQGRAQNKAVRTLLGSAKLRNDEWKAVAVVSVAPKSDSESRGRVEGTWMELRNSRGASSAAEPNPVKESRGP